MYAIHPTGGRAWGGQREDVCVVRPDSSASQIWWMNESICASRSVWVAPLEHALHVHHSTWTFSDGPEPYGSRRCRGPKKKKILKGAEVSDNLGYWR
jgi:hypothetical protein